MNALGCRELKQGRDISVAEAESRLAGYATTDAGFVVGGQAGLIARAVDRGG